MGQGNVFTRMCHSDLGGGERGSAYRCMGRPPQVCLRGEICIQGVGQPPPRYMGYGQQASCTHPTGMLSCSILCSVQIVNECLHCVKSFVNVSHAIGLNKELNKIFQNKKSFFSSTFIFIVLENIKFFSFL